MKKNLLLIIFVISTIASAQNQLRLKEVRQKEKSPQEVLQAFPDVKTWKTPGVISPQKINEYIAARQKKADQLQLMDSMRFWDWNDVDGGWENSNKTIKMTYDNKNRLVSSIEQEWNFDTDEWVNSIKSTYTYNNNGDATFMLMEGWEEDEWIGVIKVTWTYDGNSNLITSKTELWMDEWITFTYTVFTYDNNHNILTETTQTTNFIQPLTNSSKEIFTYDTKNNMLTSISQTWESGNWVNKAKTINTYNNNNDKLTITNQEWKSGNWVYATKQTFTYNSNGDETNWLDQVWEAGEWKNVQQENYVYDSRQNISTETFQIWENGGWVNNSRYTYTYTNSNLPLTELDQRWEANAWLNYTQTTYAYDTHGNNTTQTTETWQDNAWYRSGLTQETYDSNNYLLTYANRGFETDGITVHSGDSARYYYHAVASGVYDMTDERMTVYPNPVKDYLTLKIDATSSDPTETMTYSLYDLNGKLLESRKLYGNTTRISMKNLQPSTYIMKISQGSRELREFKIIKM